MNIGKEVRDEYGKCTKGGLFQGGGWLLAVCAASLCASLEGAVSAGSGGTVSTAVEGAQVVATAVPDAGKRFFRWTGDVGLEDPAAETIRVAADADVTALFGNEITVEQDGSGDCPTLNAALDAAADYDTIVLGDGEHTNATPAFAVVANAVKVVSRNGREKTFFKSVKTPNGSGVINVNPAYKGLQVNNDLAIVKGVTFFNFGADGVQSPIGLGIYLQKGLVEFCTVSNCVPNHGCSAIHVVDGEVRHSLIANNRSAGSQGKENAANGAGVRITGAGVVTNCVITGNYANKSVAHGAGAYVAHADARLVDCQIVGNARGAEGYGGGVYLADGTVENCVISNNTGLAAGVYQTGGTLRNCLVAGNASEGRYGGVYATAGTIEGCVIDGNSAKEPGGSSLAMTGGEVSGTVAIEALHAVPSSGIVEVDSSVAVSGCEFQCPCEGVDGADEVNASLYYATGECFVEASRVIGRAPLAVAFTAHAAGDAGAAAWDFGDGATGSGATMAHTFSAPGVYSVGLTAGGESATLEIYVLSPVAYVSTTGLGIYPYDTWEKAANDLQSAIDAAYADDETAATVYVAAGDYAYAGANRTGESTPWARLAKRVAVIGPEEGTATFDGANNTHGVYLLNAEASMRNLTIYRCYSSLNNNDTAGGALNMTGGVVSNCVFRKCHGNFRGAVTMHGGTILDSRFEENDLNVSGADRRGAGIQIYGAGLVAGCVFEDNKGGYGGGAYIGHADAVISNCVFRGNSAGANGGGAVTVEKGLVTHCVMTNNTTSAAGGGVQISGGTVRNCVVAFNRSTSTGSNYGNGNGKAGGGGLNITGGTVENCTFYGDTSSSATRCDELSQSGGTVINCIFVGTDATPANDVRKSGGTAASCLFRTEVDGDGNIAGDAKMKNPALGEFALLYGSPCLDAGIELDTVSTDIRGEARPADGDNDGVARTDIGAYEMDFAGKMLASFEADATTGHGETSVTFTATVEGGTAPYTYYWTIGGMTYETNEGTLTHVFSFGSHDVSLNVRDATGATLDEPVVRSALVQIKSPVVYVSTTGRGEWPYETWEKATDDWTLALGAVYATASATGRVYVADGTYTRHDGDNFTINLALPVEFCGTNPACGAVFDGEGVYHKIAALNNAGALLANLKFINVKGNYGEDQGGVWLYAGTVSNCVFSGGRADGAGFVRQEGGLICDSTLEDNNAGSHTGGDRFAGGLYLLGGTAERLVIQGCRDGSSGAVRVNGAGAVLRDSVIRGNYSETGGAVLLDQGLVERCVITNNTGKAAGGSVVTFVAGPGATVRGGTMRNCLVAGNRVTSASATAGAALHVSAGLAYNNTVWGNSLADSTLSDACQTGGTLANTIAGTLDGDGTGNYVGLSPCFMDAPSGDYRLSRGSPCLNIGDWSFWGATRQEARAFKDLGGLPRLAGTSVDAGCYERPSDPGLQVFVR